VSPSVLQYKRKKRPRSGRARFRFRCVDALASTADNDGDFAAFLTISSLADWTTVALQSVRASLSSSRRCLGHWRRQGTAPNGPQALRTSDVWTGPCSGKHSVDQGRPNFVVFVLLITVTVDVGPFSALRIQGRVTTHVHRVFDAPICVDHVPDRCAAVEHIQQPFRLVCPIGRSHAVHGQNTFIPLAVGDLVMLAQGGGVRRWHRDQDLRFYHIMQRFPDQHRWTWPDTSVQTETVIAYISPFQKRVDDL